MQSQTIAETINEVAVKREVFAPIYKAFEPLFILRDSLAEELKALIKQSPFKLPNWDAQKANKGNSLLSNVPLTGLEDIFSFTGSKLFETLISVFSLVDQKEKIWNMVQDGKLLVGLSEALLNGDETKLSMLANQCELPIPVLLLSVETILGTVISALVSDFGNPWDSHPSAWTQGTCPVCGDFPSIAYLEPKIFDEKNAFLEGGGGKKHLHCGLCGTEWHFKRGVCPNCGADDSGTIEILRQEKDSFGERIEWCVKCKTYCPSIDLRERQKMPNMDVQSLAMMYLDFVAKEKGLTPLRPSVWNQ